MLRRTQRLEHANGEDCGGVGMKRTIAVSLVLIVCLACSWCVPAASVRASDAPRRSYIIVLGTDGLKTSAGLKSFVDYKSTNFEVTVVSMPDIAKQFPTVTDKVEQLRQYLDTKTRSVPPYVLLVGSVDEIPMSKFKTEYDTVGLQIATTDCVLEYDKPWTFFDANHNGVVGEATDLESISNGLSPVFAIGRIFSDDTTILNNYFLSLLRTEQCYEINPSLVGTVAGAIIQLPSANQASDLNDGDGEKLKSSFPEVNWTSLFEHTGTFTSSLGQALTKDSFVDGWNHSDIVYTSAHGGRWRIVWTDGNHNGVADDGESSFEEFCSNTTDSRISRAVYLAWYNGCSTVDTLGSYHNSFSLNLFDSGKSLNFVGYTGVENGASLQAFQFFGFIRKGYSAGDSLEKTKMAGIQAAYKTAQGTLYNVYELTLVGDPSARVNNRLSSMGLVGSNKLVQRGGAIDLSWDNADPISIYNVQISDSSDFTNLVKSDITYANSYQITSLPVGNYFWRVQGVYDNGVGDWSETKSFGVYEPLSLVVNSLPAQVSDPEVVVSGSTNGSRILVNNQEQIITNGKFSTVVALSSGKNTIKVVAFDAYNHSTSKELVVTYQVQKTETVLRLTIGIPTIWVDGKPLPLDVAPSIINSRTLVPLRAIFEAVGGDVGWDPATRQITIVSRGQKLVLTIGKNTANLNGASVSIDSANPKVVPIIINGRTMLPLRFIAENLGFHVVWDEATKTITLSMT